MSEAAQVTSVEQLRTLRAALCTFQVDARDALYAVDGDVRRVFDWLEDQLKYWQQVARERYEDVLRARNELALRKLVPYGDREPDCSEQEDNLLKAERRLHEAEEKMAITRQWIPRLRRAVDDYSGPAHQLASLLEGNLPRACAALEQKIGTLESYLALTPPVHEEGDPA